MTQLVPFFFNGLDVRVTDRDGNPWFVLADVCRVLGLSNPSQAASTLDDDEKYTLTNSEGIASAQVQTLNIISESGLYSLVLRSRKQEARAFKRWITSEVIPSIRKTGRYGADPNAILNDPNALRGLLANYSERVIALEGRNAVLEPKAQALDRIATAHGSLCITDAAKVLQLQPRELFNYLHRSRWIFRRPGTGWLGYSEKSRDGLVEHKCYTIDRADGSTSINEQVRITPKGLARLARIFDVIKPAA